MLIYKYSIKENKQYKPRSSELDDGKTILLGVSCLWPWAGWHITLLHFLQQKGKGRQDHLGGEVTE